MHSEGPFFCHHLNVMALGASWTLLPSPPVRPLQGKLTHSQAAQSLPAPPPHADGPQRHLSGHLPLDISETPRASLSQGRTTIVLTVPLPNSILCSPFAQAQIPAPSGHHPVPHDPSPSSWSLASLARVGDRSYGGWLGVAVSGSSCLSRAGVSELQGTVTPLQTSHLWISVPRPLRGHIPSPSSPPRGSPPDLEPGALVASSLDLQRNLQPQQGESTGLPLLLLPESPIKHAGSLGLPLMGLCNYNPIPLDLFIPETSSGAPLSRPRK